MPSLSINDREGYLGTASAVLIRLLEDAVYENNATEYKDDDTYRDEDEYGYSNGYDGKNKGPVPLDYSVLSIGILTLGLILFVEVTRHWIDHQAHGKPFFNAVLVMLYSECTLLF